MTVASGKFKKSWLERFCFCRKKIQQRLALYQGVCPIYMEFSGDAEETFANALATLLVNSKESLSKKLSVK